MRRFYREVSLTETAADPGLAAGFEIRLDGKPLRTPARAPLRLPTRPLAEAVAAEWAGQGETLRPAEMHLMQLAATAIDRVAPNRDLIVGQVAAYAETDLVCYRAEAPSELVLRQRSVWQPLLDWCRTALDAPLAETAGIVPRPQPPEALAAIRAAVAAQDTWRLTALQVATAALGSVVLGLALLEGRIDPDGALAAAELDARFQAERWGVDAEAEARSAALAAEIGAAHRFAALL